MEPRTHIGPFSNLQKKSLYTAASAKTSLIKTKDKTLSNREPEKHSLSRGL